MITKDIIEQLRGKSAPEILVVGDIMLDHYIIGSANRLSPEAPVPILEVRKERESLGGAANLALNLARLGASVSLSGLAGNDDMAEKVQGLIAEAGITPTLLRDPSRPTTLKSRVLAGTHQLLRLDRENTAAISPAIQRALENLILPLINKAAIIVISDYMKGLMTASFTQFIIQQAKAADKNVLIDPKGIDYDKYRGAHLVKPNRKELIEASRIQHIHNMEELHLAASTLRKNLELEFVVTTLSEEGLAITDEQKTEHFPVKANEVFDVTGAGDTVLAVIAYCLSQGTNLETACELANQAAAIVVKKVGSATVTLDELMEHLS